MAFAALTLPASASAPDSFVAASAHTYVGKTEDSSESRILMISNPVLERWERIYEFKIFGSGPHHPVKASWTKQDVLFAPRNGEPRKFELGPSGPIDWLRGWDGASGFHGKYSIDGHEHDWHVKRGSGFPHPYTGWSGSTDPPRYLIDFRLVQQFRPSDLVFERFVIRDAQTGDVVERLEYEFGFSGGHMQWDWKPSVVPGLVRSVKGRVEADNAIHGEFTINGQVHRWYAWLDGYEFR